MSRQSENSYEHRRSTWSTWRDKLTDKHTFENWKLHRHQIRTMMNTSMPLHRIEVESSGRMVDSNVKSSGGFNNVTYDGRDSLPGRSDSSSKSGPKKERRVKKRVLYTLLGVIGLIGIAAPVIVVMLLRTLDGKAPEAKVGTVDLEVTVQNMQFSEALADPESEDYRNFTMQFCQEMETFYRRSSIGEKYEGCLVKELRHGSIKVVFILVFTSEYLPVDMAVRKVFTDNATPSNSGTLEVTVGIYVITESSIVVGQVTVIANDENPTPRIGHGHSCKVTTACRTYQAVCDNEKCGCGSSRHYSSSSDSCVLIPTTTTSTSTEPTTTSTSTSDTTSTKHTLPNFTTVSVTSSTSLSTQSVTTPSASSLTSKSSAFSSSTDSPTFTPSVSSTTSKPFTSSYSTTSPTFSQSVSSTTSKHSNSSSSTASPTSTLLLSPSSSAPSISSSTTASSTFPSTSKPSTSPSTTVSQILTPSASSTTSTQSTSSSSVASPITSTSTPLTSTQTSSSPAMSTSSAVPTKSTPPSTHPTPQSSSTTLPSLEDIFFDKGLAYTVATGDILSLTCSFQNLIDVQQLKISRGENKDVIMILNRNGTLDQRLNHFTLSTYDWRNDSGSVTISANITCGDENLYICKTDSNSGEANISITVRSRPEKPTLTLSYELIEGQLAWADRLSECKAQVGDPAGNLVVEILIGDVFQEYKVEYGKDFPQNRSLECGIEQTIQFFFSISDLVGLNNTEIRCAVKPAEVFKDTEKLTSESQVLRTVDSSYCIGIDALMYVHPYDCHYFVDCNRFGSADFHFHRCDNPDFCPNPSLGICDIRSCATLCNRGPKPYLRCNGNTEAEFNDHVTIRCELGNVEAITFETVAILQGDTVVFNETWASGTASAQDWSVVLTYTAEEIVLSIAQIDCQQNAVYTFLVNDLLSDTATVAIKTNATTPAISSTRFVAGQLATITCNGIIGNPPESKKLFIEAWVTEGPYMTEDFEPQSTSSEVTKFNSSTCLYQKKVNLTIEVKEIMNGIIKIRCRTATDSVNLISEVVNINVATQEIDIQPPESKVEVGDELSIECTITGVSDLTYIRFYRGTVSPQTICQVTQGSLSNSVSGIVCSGEVSSTVGRVVMKFSSVQCDHEDTYVCECNPEASTRKRTSLSITRPPQYPVFKSVPKTLVENKPLLDAERFTCEVDLGYPTSNMLIIQSNKDGEHETYDDVLGVERSIHNENCSIFETVTVNYYTFDASWNNTQLRCAIADVNGTVTTYVSDEFTLLLLPETFCNGPVGYYLHPYDIHLYVWCTGTGIFVYTCNEQCPAIIDGVATCGDCDTS